MTYYVENIFVCLTVPLILSLLFRNGKQRVFTAFVIIGMASCLFSAYISSFWAGYYEADVIQAVREITPVCEEVMKFLPFLFYLMIFEPETGDIISPAIGIAVGFATFENVCYLIEDGAQSFYYILIRGLSAGVLHILCGIALGAGVAYVFRKKWIRFTGTVGALGACIVFHGIYNVLISADGLLRAIGYLFPIILTLILFIARKIQISKKLEFD